MKIDLFQMCGLCRVFQICWHIEYSTLTASSFRINNNNNNFWNSTPQLALFIVMLSKAHLTSHSRISGSRSETTPSLSSGSLKPFCIVILYIHTTSSLSLLILLGPYHFCPLLLPSWHGMFHWYLEFSWCDLYSFQFYCFPLFLCIVHLKRLSYLTFEPVGFGIKGWIQNKWK